MTKDEALKMAIDFMETLTIDVGIKIWNEKHRKEAINACEEALEQPAQEVMELEEALKHCDGKDCNCYAYYQWECACDADWTPEEVVKLRYQLNNTHPHQWQGLTDNEVDNIYPCAEGVHDFRDIVRAIEQALKEKNT